MANQWLRLWHDMPTDPKWRTIARLSGRRIGDVIAVYTHILVAASNAPERGRTQSFNCEDVASALDLETSDVEAIVEAMQTRVLDGDRVAGWEKRQPAREDGSAERARAWRDAQKAKTASPVEGCERNRTQTERNQPTDKDTDKEINTPPTPKGERTVHDFPPGFTEFWSAYPKKVGKDAAAKAFKRKASAVLLPVLLEAIKSQKAWAAWLKDGGQYIPNPATWLNEGRWQDERQGAALTADIFAGAR